LICPANQPLNCFAGYLALFIWDFAAPDPASTRYFWESAPGYIIIALRIISFGFYIFSLIMTLRLETLPEKRRFYFGFGAGYGVWFISLPFIVMIAAILSDQKAWVLLKASSVPPFFFFPALLLILCPYADCY